MARNKRPDTEYEIEALTKALAVLEALEGRDFEPVGVAKIMERSGIKSRNTVERILKTYRLRGYTTQTGRKWTIAKRLVRFAQAVSRHESEF